MLTIRPEQPEDRPGIYRVNELAFDHPERPRPIAEAELVDRLRLAGAVTLSLVAERNGEISGHVLFSPGRIQAGKRQLPAQALAPVAVLPAFQRQGIGSLLIREGIERLRQAGHESLFVLGHPGYYPRFGFLPAASTYGIRCADYDVSDEVFMALELLAGALKEKQGAFYYHPLFEGV